jgi:3-hydroxymyristoyl/3-hydroxydecanoyl-(acyl carrier protein) dehydratase
MSFVLIDKLLYLGDSQVVAEKVFQKGDSVFLDHFPGSGIVPGSLLLEGMAQTCGWWISWKSENLSKSALLMADGMRFRQFVRPEEKIRFEGNVLQNGPSRARFEARAWVGDKRVAEGELSFAVFDLKQASGPFDAGLISGWMKEKFEILDGPAAAGRSG